ncbi:MAG: aspartate--tRNA(Asp/Asn) ligase [Planctomycetota bacterium]|nr:MAG: aspartate--tRNA(Asp/Asn) ligase [Planctomycetota bacterium]
MSSQGIRTHNCGELRAEHVGKTVRLSGWVASPRDLGALVFLDLRDRYGITQVSFDESVPEELRKAAGMLKPESVIQVEGVVRARPDGQANADRSTGAIELLASSLELLGPCATPPFPIDADKVSDELRLTYRYLDLRRERPLAAMKLRHKLLLALRQGLDARDFLEIETPILTKATPEGARDYLVPSRVHPGKFFALPQSPQIFKQILMVSGMDKYFQIVKCFRDEDLRADRQPEFTQLDLELSFADEQVVQDLVSEVIADAVGAVRPEQKPQLPMPRMTWAESMQRFGNDKPDTRFAVELSDVTELVRESGFGVFANAVKAGGRVRVLAAPGGAAFSRKEITGLEAIAKDYGAKGLAWTKLAEGGGVESGIGKFLSDAEVAGLIEATGAKPGDAFFFGADSFKVSAAALSAVRLEIARKLDLIDHAALNFLWITDFPMFDVDEESGALAPAHHPFCRPKEAYEGELEKDPGAVIARSYDLVLNGCELGSGSVRIHDTPTQQKVFEALGLSAEEIRLRFGFVLDCFKYGAPPHAGFAVGLDRLVMLLAGEDSIREVIAFPKTAQAADLMTGAPTSVDVEQIHEAGVQLLPPSNKSDAPKDGERVGGAEHEEMKS